jgi:hypothetical protein
MWKNKNKIQAIYIAFCGSTEAETRRDRIANKILKEAGIQNLLVRVEKET